MMISCFSLTELAKLDAALMPAGGAMATLTYNGGQRAMRPVKALHARDGVRMKLTQPAALRWLTGRELRVGGKLVNCHTPHPCQHVREWRPKS